MAPVVSEFWEKAEFPFPLVPKIGALNIGGGTLKDYGCQGLSTVACGMATIELVRRGSRRAGRAGPLVGRGAGWQRGVAWRSCARRNCAPLAPVLAHSSEIFASYPLTCPALPTH